MSESASTRRATYTVRAERSGDWWALVVPELPGAFSQVRDLKDAERNAREAVALMLDVDPGSFDLSVVIFPTSTDVGGRGV